MCNLYNYNFEWHSVYFLTVKGENCMTLSNLQAGHYRIRAKGRQLGGRIIRSRWVSFCV